MMAEQQIQDDSKILKPSQESEDDLSEGNNDAEVELDFQGTNVENSVTSEFENQNFRRTTINLSRSTHQVTESQLREAESRG